MTGRPETNSERSAAAFRELQERLHTAVEEFLAESMKVVSKWKNP